MWIPIFSCGWCRCGAVLHLYSCGRCIPASYFPTTHFLLWMVPLRRCTTPLFVGMMHPCILPSHCLLSLVDGAAAALSYTFTRGDDASLHLTFPLPNWSCSLTSMRRSQLLILGDPRFTSCVVPHSLYSWVSQLTSDHLIQARATLRPVRPSGRSPKLH